MTDNLVDTFDEQKPAPVREAEKYVRLYGATLGTIGTFVTIWYWIAAINFGTLIVPLTWWVVFLIALVTVFFLPPTRGARMARQVLRRWDELKVERLLEMSGSSLDPRMRVAEDMGRRILAHPQTDEGAHRATSALLAQLKRSLMDLRTTELMAEAAQNRGSASASSLRDPLDYVEARVGELVSRLEAIHRAVVLRDDELVDQVTREAEEVLSRLQAEKEVDRLLNPPS